MKENIRNFFNNLVPLPVEEWQAMENYFSAVSFQKKDILLEEGEICDFIGFIESGVLRFYQLSDGNEKVTAFWFPGDFLSNYRSFIANKPSAHLIQALSSGTYWRINKKDLYNLYNCYPIIDRLGRKMAEQLYLMVTHRLDNLLLETPEQRYLNLQMKKSRLLQEIPQYMLASYLGVSAETLSRIRKRLTKK